MERGRVRTVVVRFIIVNGVSMPPTALAAQRTIILKIIPARASVVMGNTKRTKMERGCVRTVVVRFLIANDASMPTIAPAAQQTIILKITPARASVVMGSTARTKMERGGVRTVVVRFFIVSDASMPTIAPAAQQTIILKITPARASVVMGSTRRMKMERGGVRTVVIGWINVRCAMTPTLAPAAQQTFILKITPAPASVVMGSTARRKME